MSDEQLSDNWYRCGETWFSFCTARTLIRRAAGRLKNRRQFLRAAAQATGSVVALSILPPSIRKALAIPAAVRSGSIEDVRHIVILMQENRSFDHSFGKLRGVRDFGDRHPIPLASGKTVWYQFDGKREMSPFHLDTKTTSALRVASTPHSFSDAQAAWNQGMLGFWPAFKTATALGYYRRADIPFQFALADAFTICDAYHCSVTTGTDPNRIVFWSGSNFKPQLRARSRTAQAQTPSLTICAAGYRERCPLRATSIRAPLSRGPRSRRCSRRQGSLGACIRTRTTTGRVRCTAVHNWHDFTASAEGFERRFAGRMEINAPSFSDPATGS
jgi:Phosphoesterase family